MLNSFSKISMLRHKHIKESLFSTTLKKKLKNCLRKNILLESSIEALNDRFELDDFTKNLKIFDP